MKTIETKEQLIAWACEINQGVTISRKCDMQDIYAHSKQSDIDRLFVEVTTDDRRLIICSVTNCMAFEEVERLLRVLARARVTSLLTEEQNDLDKSWRKLADAQSAFEDHKRAINKRFNKVREERDTLQRLYDNCDKGIKDITAKAESYKVKANKYDKIKDLLK